MQAAGPRVALVEDLAKVQLVAIAELVDAAGELNAPVWLRGGWAMDFFLGRVTREHLDIDWFVLVEDAARLREQLLQHGFVDVTTADPEQQIDLRRGRVDHGIAIIRLDDQGNAVVAGGTWAGEPWPVGMLDGRIGRIGDTRAPVISPGAQIEIKTMLPVWNPTLRRRQKDLDDVAALQAHCDRSNAERRSAQ